MQNELGVPRQKVVLVIGPDPELAETVAKVLPEWCVRRTSSNETALEAIRSESLDLVLTGENTSGAADLELLRKIRKCVHIRA